jgi:hypothetical protein
MRNPKLERRGAAVTEMSIILIVFLTLTLGMLDLGVGLFRSHMLDNAARHGARRAIVHGEYANALGSWGPGTINVPASANGVPIVDGPDGMQGLLNAAGCDLPASRVIVEWLDNTNAVDSRVRVTVTSAYTPIFAFIFPNGTINLSASSTMTIAH